MRYNETKHIWLPAILTLYTVLMAFLGRDMLLVKGDYVQFFGILLGETVVIIALSWFLRRRYRMLHSKENTPAEGNPGAD